MNYLKKKYKISGSDHLFLKPALQAIKKCTHRFNCDFVIIGATARDFLIQYIFRSKLDYRATKDLDLTILIDSWDEFNNIMEVLVSDFDFIKGSQIQRLYLEGLPVDIIPFGRIAKGGSIYWPPEGIKKINIAGFKKVFATSIHCQFDELEIRISCLEALFITKIIAWNERKFETTKDAEDISIIIYNYHDFFPDDLFDKFLNLLKNLIMTIFWQEQKS